MNIVFCIVMYDILYYYFNTSGCTIRLDSKHMLEERAKAEAGSLNVWLRRCRATGGEVYNREVFYNVVGVTSETRLVEQVQLRSARIFLAVGRLHPEVVLQFEMRMTDCARLLV